MDYNTLESKIGTKFSIVEGYLLEDTNGQFTVSYDLVPYSIYLDRVNKTYTVLAPRKEYIGRVYALRRNDCANLFAEWHDGHFGTSFLNTYNNLTHRQYLEIFNGGMSKWFLENGFAQVTEPQHGDCMVYDFRSDAKLLRNHVGIYLEGHNILHHISGRLSSIDPVLDSRVIGYFRYG